MPMLNLFNSFPVCNKNQMRVFRNTCSPEPNLFWSCTKHVTNFIIYTRNIGIEKLTDLSADFRETLLLRAGLQDKNREEMHICLHHKQVFSNVFERKNEKCGGILKHHKRKAQGKR